MKIVLGRKTVDVQWGLVDRAVAWLSPAAGMERLKGRLMMGAATGGYTGGKRDRRSTRNWRPGQTSANEELSADLPDLRARSRDLSRNVPLATGAIHTVVTGVVGGGFTLASRIDQAVLGLSDEQAVKWQQKAEREFAIWAKRADFTSRLNFDGQLELAFRSVLESGDVFVVRRRRFDPGDTYGLKLQLVEADRCSNPGRRQDTVSMVDGVELDSDGVPVAYHFSSRHPDDMGRNSTREWRRYDAGVTATGTPIILHLYRQMRPDQVRGAPFLSPVIDALKQLGDYADAEIRAAVISAMFTVFIKQETPDDGQNSIIGTNDSTANVDPKTELQLGSGAIVDLGPGEEPVFADPTRPNPAFDAFVKATCRHIGVALEIPVELLLKSFGTSYSASRAALEMAWQMFSSRQDWLKWNFCQPVYEWVITEAVSSGRLSAPGFFADPIVREAWLGSAWEPPRKIQLDPQKEAAASLILRSAGIITNEYWIRQTTGGDFESTTRQLAKENAALKAAGISTPGSVSEALQPKESRLAAKPEEDPADETTTEKEPS